MTTYTWTAPNGVPVTSDVAPAPRRHDRNAVAHLAWSYARSARRVIDAYRHAAQHLVRGTCRTRRKDQP